MHDKGGLASPVQLLRLLAFVIGIEHESRRLDILQKNHPGIWHPIRIHSRKSNGIGIIQFGSFSLLQPRLGDLERVFSRKFA